MRYVRKLGHRRALTVAAAVAAVAMALPAMAIAGRADAGAGQTLTGLDPACTTWEVIRPGGPDGPLASFARGGYRHDVTRE
jgi:hypothetical protein